MGTFYSTLMIENIINRKKAATFAKALVETGIEYTCVPGDMLEKLSIKREKKDLKFVMANGVHIIRPVGFAIVRVNDASIVD